MFARIGVEPGGKIDCEDKPIFFAAQAIDLRLQPLHKDLFVEANPIPVKWAVARMGLIGNAIRLPLVELSAAHHDTVLRAMRAVLPPGTAVLPVGGIDASNMAGWRQAGAARGYLAVVVLLGLTVTALVLAQAGLLARALASAAPGAGPVALRPVLLSLLLVVLARAAAVYGGEVAALRAAGVTFQTFDLPGDATWTDGVLSDGSMKAAWFADPDGNVLNIESDPTH